MSWRFWRREKKSVGSIYLPGVGRISAERVANYILSFKISDVIYSIISLIQQAAVIVPWYLYREQGDSIIEVRGHPLADFLQRPGRRLSWASYIENYIGHLLLTGNCYQRVIIPSFKTKIEVEFLRPDRVKPKLQPGGDIVYEYERGGKLERFSEEEVVEIKLYNPETDGDSLRGLSPIAPQAKLIDIGSFAQEWIFRLLEKGAMPAIALSTDRALTNEQKEYLREQIRRDVLGPENVINPLVLEGGLRVEKIGFSPKDIDFEHILKLIMRKIANVYHVPSELLGDAENKTYSNVKEAEKALYYKAVLPHLARLRDALNFFLIQKVAPGEGFWYDYDVSAIDALSADMAEVWERAGRAVDRGIITRNEAREMMKYGRSAEAAANVLTVSANVIPLEVLAGPSGERGEEKE